MRLLVGLVFLGSIVAVAGDHLAERLEFGEQRLVFLERDFPASVAVGELAKWRLVDDRCLLRQFAPHEVQVVRLTWDSPPPRCTRCEEMRRRLPAVKTRFEKGTLTEDDRAWIRANTFGPMGIVALELGGRVYLYSFGHSQLTCGFDLEVSVAGDDALEAEVMRQWPRLRALKR